MVQKALVVDDDEMILYLLEYILEANGYDITKATDGDQAIKLLNVEDFDLVITDLKMGQTNGFEVIRKAKQINQRSIVVMITGSCDSSDESEAFRQGADEFVLKPFFLVDLLARIQYQESRNLYQAASIVHREQRGGTCQDKLQSVKQFSSHIQPPNY